MNDKTALLASIALSASAALVAAILLVRTRAKLVAHLSFGGFLLLVLWTSLFTTQPLLWSLSLLPSWGHLTAPFLPGAGGSAYGLDYRQYFPASVLFVFLGAGPVLLFSLIIPGGRYPEPGAVLQKTIGDISILLRRIEPVVAVISVLIFVCYFSAYGWERFWYSQQGRFESISTQGWLAIFNGVKVLLPALLVLGAANGLLLYFTRKPLIVFSVALLCLLPFAVSSSRGFSIILISIATGLLWRFRLPQWLRFIMLSLVGIYALIIPLISRGEGTTGLQVFFQTHTTLFSEGRSQAASMPLVTLAQSAAQGFPILVEALEVKSTGASIVSDLPLRYWLLSLSPTISMIDGYGLNYVMMGPRVNYFTPFSTVAMLSAVSSWVVVLFYAVCFGFTLLLQRWLSRHGSAGSIGIILVTVAFGLGLLQSTQYDLRTTTRFFYAAWECGIGFLLFLRFFHFGSTSPRLARKRAVPLYPNQSENGPA